MIEKKELLFWKEWSKWQMILYTTIIYVLGVGATFMFALE